MVRVMLVWVLQVMAHMKTPSRKPVDLRSELRKLALL